MRHSAPVQLPLLDSLHPVAHDAGSLAGCWSVGERCLPSGAVQLGDVALTPSERYVWVNVWFHFFEGGEAILSLRQKDQDQPSRVHGRWWLEARQLVVSFSGGDIRSPFTLRDDVLQWAGETMLRLSDRTASLAFGIQLPYRCVVPDAIAPLRS